MSTIQSSHGGDNLAAALQELYATGQTDYSFEPLVLSDKEGKPVGRIKDGDSIIFCLRRGEREIQLTEAFVDPLIGGFPRASFTHLPFIILTLYHEKFHHLPVAFASSKIKDTLAEVISKSQLHQLHIAESEKYAHVTFFLNGGNNQPFEFETDIRVPSQRGIPADEIPGLSLPAVADQVIKGMQQANDLIITNFANGDVIGHTSNCSAKIQCAEIVDAHLGRVVDSALENNYLILITADHGNLELMTNPDGSPNVAHTTNPVPFLIISRDIDRFAHVNPGRLADIAPTLLSLLGVPIPTIMKGNCLYHPGDIKPCKVLLIILDGWGIGKHDETNPIYLARTPNWDRYLTDYPHTQLAAAGISVGLKDGKAGNSEAGHMNIGAGRVIEQDDVRLDHALQDGTFYSNEIFLKTLADVKQRNSNLHLIGLLSEKSSHGSIDYPLALLKMAKEKQVNNVYIHLIFDGRSTEPGSAPELLRNFEKKVHEIGVGKIVTGMGRGFALDRDGNYQKTKCAYDALVFGTGKKYREN